MNKLFKLQNNLAISLAFFLLFIFVNTEIVHAAGVSTLRGFVDLIVGTIITSLTTLFSSLAVVAFFYGIAQYIFGIRDANADKIGKGQTFMAWGLVALFVMFSVWGIIKYGQGMFGIDSNAPIVIPSLQIGANGGSKGSRTSGVNSPFGADNAGGAGGNSILNKVNGVSPVMEKVAEKVTKAISTGLSGNSETCPPDADGTTYHRIQMSDGGACESDTVTCEMGYAPDSTNPGYCKLVSFSEACSNQRDDNGQVYEYDPYTNNCVSPVTQSFDKCVISKGGDSASYNDKYTCCVSTGMSSESECSAYFLGNNGGDSSSKVLSAGDLCGTGNGVCDSGLECQPIMKGCQAVPTGEYACVDIVKAQEYKSRCLNSSSGDDTFEPRPSITPYDNTSDENNFEPRPSITPYDNTSDENNFEPRPSVTPYDSSLKSPNESCGSNDECLSGVCSENQDGSMTCE